MAEGTLFKGSYTILDPVAMTELLEGPIGPVMKDMLERSDRIKNYAASRVRPSRVRGGEGTDSSSGRSLRDSGEAYIGPVPSAYRGRNGIAPGVSTSFTGGIAGIVVFSKPYATFVDQGTGPHEIRPKTAKALRFYSQKLGMVVFARSVHHPGSRPTHFLSGAITAGSG